MATKIAIVITKLELGGAQKSVLYTARHIADNFEPFLLCGAGGYLDKYAKDHIKNLTFIKHLERPINPIKDMRAFFEIGKTLKEIKPQIVHTNSSKAGILGRLAAKVYTKAKIIHTVHGFAFYEGQNTFVKHFYILLEKLLAKVTDVLIFVSKKDMQNALDLKIITPEKARLIRAGVRVYTPENVRDFNKEKLKEELGLKPENKVVLSISNLKPQKNPLDSVRAAKEVCKILPNTVFLYLGTGPLEKETQNLIKEYKLENNFKLLGHRNDTTHLLTLADAFMLTSLWEGLPMALVEAFFMKVPAVCYNVGGVAEVLQDGENGFLIPPHDYKKSAEKLLEILQGNFKFKEHTLALLNEFDIKDMLLRQQELYTLFGDKNSLFTGV